MKRVLFLCILSLYALTAWGGEYRRLGQDYRALAMGNTGIATANNSSALFYNPATMSNIFSWWLDLPMLEATYSDDAKYLYNQAKTGSFALNTQQEQFDFMNSFIGKNPYMKVRLGSNFFVNLNSKGFTLGANYTYEALLDLRVRNPSLPEINGLTRLDHIRQYGASIPFGVGQFVLGVSVKKLERQELIFNYGMGDALENKPFPTLANDGGKGSGQGYDLGFVYRTDTASKLIIGGVFRQKILLGTATPIPEEVALGFGMLHNFGPVRLVSALDFRDLTFKGGAVGDKSIARRTHLGFELGLIPLNKGDSLINIRTGFAQGNQSTGAEINLFHTIVIGLTKYWEETGEYAGQFPSHRTVAYFSMGI